MQPLKDYAVRQTRRQFFGSGGVALGTAALASILGQEAGGAEDKVGESALAGFPSFAPKAKRVIYLFQGGAPSHLDLYDYKPGLIPRRGEQLPDSVRMGQRLTTMTAGQKDLPVLPGITGFTRHGQSGLWINDFMPHIGSIADDLCLVRSMYTEAINHAPAVTFLLTGAEQPGRPSIGAWLAYGLGTLNHNLPTFIVMTSRDREASCGQLFYEHYWGTGFLPTKLQGVQFRSSGDPVLYLSNPAGVPKEVRRGVLDDLAALNEHKLAKSGDPEIATRISQYEMAFRMQSSLPEISDISTEPQHVQEMYGPDVLRPGSFAGNCLRARRLAEKGVRFIQLMHAGWDQHQNLPTQLEIQCRDTDQPSAALVKDLKMRGLLDETLVIWGGEFGRTPFGQGDIKNPKVHGRDHHPRCFSIWMAGGGIKGGTVHGETDDYAYNVAKDGVHIHDLQATILHLLGLDHEKLTFKFQGRYYRLTDVHGHVVNPVLA